ncbi:hypothetical protein BBBOND_0206180 [Babesia bigemina]|uniref:Uncharacterized protein n=1 Tax=Babesia bigemina TaxID=5866 RepID=A0A061DCC0_BABBI|nr:hypothetical protein BBBOND_0206180 [Babesia bigemina]CDR95460.1 hypothetical protein BBBOND_0206180 [Babesia bigemina]|eukprot:XP_012767646.1 hypothetical protein BBBOND_0206180 [Babesia bigemina]
MVLPILQYFIAAVKLTLALSPLLVIVAIFAVNKNCNQRSSEGSRSGARIEYIDSSDDDTKNDW